MVLSRQHEDDAPILRRCHALRSRRRAAEAIRRSRRADLRCGKQSGAGCIVVSHRLSSATDGHATASL